MSTGLSLTAAPALSMHTSPALVAFAELLVLPGTGVEQQVEQMIADNPALEWGERPTCRMCGGRSAGCRLCELVRAPHPVDGLGSVQQDRSAAEMLVADAGPEVALADRPLLDLLVGSLDENGFLDTDPDDLAPAFGVAPARLRRVLEALRRAGPPGIAARDVRECLLLQLDGHLGASPLVRRIVEVRLEELAARRYRSVAEATGYGIAEVEAAHDYIRTRLRARPLQGLPGRRPVAWVTPDLLVSEQDGDGGGHRVELLERYRCPVTINPGFERWVPSDLLSRARVFLTRLRQRQQTITLVAQYAVDRQQRFFSGGGGRDLVPLTRTRAAADLGMHESTVSRAVTGRWLEPPSGRLVPLARLFEPSAGVRAALREVIASERRSLSDAEIAAELTRRGYRIARRTVAKHRDALGIPARRSHDEARFAVTAR